MTASLTRITSLSQLAEFREGWKDLLARCPGYSFAQTPDYCAAATEYALQRGNEVLIASVERDGRFVALWPVMIWREGLLRIMRPVSCGSNEEYNGPLFAGGREALAELMGALLTVPCDTFWIYNVAEGSPLRRELVTGVLSGIPRRTVELPGFKLRLSAFAKWEDYLAQASKSDMHDLRRLLRRLREMGEVEIGWCKDQHDAEKAITWLFAAKRDWASARCIHTPWLMEDRVPDFFNALARRVDLTSTPMVTFVKLDGKMIAVQANLISDGALEALISTYDEAYYKFSLGAMLDKFCMQWALENRLDFDFRILHGAYKARQSDLVTLYGTYEFFLSRRGRILSDIARWAEMAASKIHRFACRGARATGNADSSWF